MSNTINTVHPADGDFMMTFEQAQSMAFDGIPNSDDDQDFYRSGDSYENPANYGDSFKSRRPTVKD
ncbi:MAG: hypothetical protein K9M11_01770 [Candidatus Pacebacteria bacterium]|nr:hypothetical protein [Candidatus Paceibacterota bacterium]